MTNHPLASCIMPTHNRPAYVPHAIDYFLRQDYPARELIVLDDGDRPVGDLIPDDPMIHYQRLEKRVTLGEKRNLGCDLAKGSVVVHWDDDDWMAPWRLRYQVEQLLAQDADICGLATLLFYDPARKKTWRYRYPASNRPWVAGGTFCYRKAYWERNPFPRLNVGEDSRFVWRRPGRRNGMPRIVALEDDQFYVALIHQSNTSPKRCRGARWEAWKGDLEAIMGADLARYRSRALTSPALTREAARQAPLNKENDAGGNGMKLNLGCCDNLLSGYVNVDVVEAPGVTVADLREAWPWKDSSVDEIRAWDIIEHLPDKIFTMNEMWRVLRRGGRAEIAVPTTNGSGAWQDPTHISFWNRRSFLYYEGGNPYRERFANHYGIRACFRTVNEHVERTVDGPRLRIVLEAVKE